MENYGRLYKVLGEDGEPVNGGKGRWSLPDGDTPGPWMPPIWGELIPCEHGYHLAREHDLIEWLGPAVYEAGWRPVPRAKYPSLVTAEGKLVVKQARLIRRLDTWNERTARLFACDCAERAVVTYADSQPVLMATIATARRFANGGATPAELTAAWDAARAAARAAAGSAAGATAWAAAWAAARAAAWGAAWAAPRAAWAAPRAAWAAERAWQTKRLFEYLYPAS